MSKNRSLSRRRKTTIDQTENVSPSDFEQVLNLIETARHKAFKAVNSQLIELYWRIGAHLSEKVASAGWGKGTVQELARYIARNQPAAKGFSARNLWRMLQFHETYAGNPILLPLVTQLPWTHNLLILSRCRSDEEGEFYLRYCAREGWGKRELERQLAGALFERVALAPKQQSASLKEIHPEAGSVFKDSHVAI